MMKCEGCGTLTDEEKMQIICNHCQEYQIADHCENCEELPDDYLKYWKCPDCNGTGNQPESQVCPECGGDGHRAYGNADPMCQECQGSGTVTPDPPEESQDERIREYDAEIMNALEKAVKKYYYSGHHPEKHLMKIHDIVAEPIRKSRDEEVERLEYSCGVVAKQSIKLREEITDLHAQIEEMEEILDFIHVNGAHATKMELWEAVDNWKRRSE